MHPSEGVAIVGMRNCADRLSPSSNSAFILRATVVVIIGMRTHQPRGISICYCESGDHSVSDSGASKEQELAVSEVMRPG